MDLRTAQIADPDILNGEKLYLKRARITLPYLVRQAKAGKPIYYGDLAQEVGIPNPRNLNYVLGAIGSALSELGKAHSIEIPPIVCIVVNRTTELPGEGVGWFIDKQDFRKLTKSQQKEMVNRELTKVFAFQKWDWVLNELKIEPLKTDVNDLAKRLQRAKSYESGSSESALHRNLKEFIAKNPACLGLNKGINDGVMEYRLPSADEIDVVFSDKESKIGVEVKSRISPSDDILRGLFQCVKYKYLIEAEQIIKGQKPDSRIILVLENAFPTDLVWIKNLLGVEVMDEIKIPMITVGSKK